MYPHDSLPVDRGDVWDEKRTYVRVGAEPNDLAHLLFSLALSVSKMVGCATTSTH
jgi:hypothetical protein